MKRLDCLHTTHNIHFARWSRFFVVSASFSFVSDLFIRYLLSFLFHIQFLLRFADWCKNRLFLRLVVSKLILFFVFCYISVHFGLTATIFAGVRKMKTQTHSIAQMHTQSENFINLLPSITHVLPFCLCLCQPSWAFLKLFSLQLQIDRIWIYCCCWFNFWLQQIAFSNKNKMKWIETSIFSVIFSILLNMAGASLLEMPTFIQIYI